MSRLYFVTEDEEVELKGWEYHRLRGLPEEISSGFLGLRYDSERWSGLINPEHYMSRNVGADHLQWAQGFEVALHADGGGGAPLLMWKGKPINGWHLMLNTALVLGNDAIKLATRFGAQGEIHAWIDGPDRAWVADMIEVAVRTGVYRYALPRATVPGLDRINERKDPARYEVEPAGWSEVVALLRDRDDRPVVTHYSVMGDFPDRHQAGDVPEDVWEDLPAGERWRLSFESLTVGHWSRRFTGLQIKPDDWDTFRYGHTLTLLDLAAPDRDQRLERVAAKGWLK